MSNHKQNFFYSVNSGESSMLDFALTWIIHSLFIFFDHNNSHLFLTINIGKFLT